MNIQNTFIVGGEPKFAKAFVERLNKRLGKDLQIKIHAHKTWDQSGDRRESIPTGSDLVLVLKSNVNHSLRNWARKKALDTEIKFIECSHKIAIAEMDVRHCFNIVSGYDGTVEVEESDLYGKWLNFIGDREFVLPLWGTDDEGLFNGKDAYERMPWVRQGKKKMITKWDKVWLSYAKENNPRVRDMIIAVQSIEGRKQALTPLHVVNNGKSPYFKLIEIFKSFKEGSVGHTQVKLWADQWLRDAYLGTNFKDFLGKSNLSYALNLIFGVSLNDMSLEVKELIEEHFPKPGRPKKRVVQQPEILTQEDWDDCVAQNPVVEPVVEPVEPVAEPVVEPIVEPVVLEDHIMLGDLKIVPNETKVILNEVHLNMSHIAIHGEVSISISRVVNNTLYGVEIKKKG